MTADKSVSRILGLWDGKDERRIWVVAGVMFVFAADDGRLVTFPVLIGEAETSVWTDVDPQLNPVSAVEWEHLSPPVI